MNQLDKEVARVLNEEASAILRIRLDLDSKASKIVNTVMSATNSGHNVFMSGMGKCSFIAGKLAATYSSLGIPSFELNCAHALHGDIGSVREGDLVFIFSKSGETVEALDLARALKGFGAKTVCITCAPLSKLVQLCDMDFVINDGKEACHLGLAPTTSTTAMLAVGDAIGVVASKEMGFKKKDFNKRHKKGKLGEVSNEKHSNSVADV